MRINNYSLTKGFIALLSIFAIWNFMFTMTETSWSGIVYVFLICLSVMICMLVLLYRPSRISTKLCLWLPFIVLIVIGNYKIGNFEGIIYYSICFALMLLSRYIDWNNMFPERIIVVSGVIMIIGIWFQILVPSVYNAYIATFFKNTNDILYWSNGYGYAGFTYQLGVTAIILIYFEGIVIYSKFDDRKKQIILLLLIIVCIFLTGKRAVALLAILLPVIDMLLSNRVTSKRTFNVLAVVSILGVLVYFLAMNAELFIDSKVLGRFASTIIDMENGQDISSHRSILYSEAIQLFNNNKLWGIGLGQYKELSQFGTDVHNSYLQVLCEMGITGFVCYIVPLLVNLISCIKKNRYKDKKYLKVALFIQLFFILYGLTGNVSVNEFCFVFYFISISMTAGMNKFEGGII